MLLVCILNINCFKAILWSRAESYNISENHLSSLLLPHPLQSFLFRHAILVRLKFDTIAIPFHISSSEIDTGCNSSEFNSLDVADTEK